jgi:hypothetical protein
MRKARHITRMWETRNAEFGLEISREERDPLRDLGVDERTV